MKCADDVVPSGMYEGRFVAIIWTAHPPSLDILYSNHQIWFEIDGFDLCELTDYYFFDDCVLFLALCISFIICIHCLQVYEENLIDYPLNGSMIGMQIWMKYYCLGVL